MNRALYVQRQSLFFPLSTVLLKSYFFCRSGCFPHLFIIACCCRILQNWNQAIQILFYLRRVLLSHAMYSSGLIRQISKGLFNYLMPTPTQLVFRTIFVSEGWEGGTWVQILAPLGALPFTATEQRLHLMFKGNISWDFLNVFLSPFSLLNACLPYMALQSNLM